MSQLFLELVLYMNNGWCTNTKIVSSYSFEYIIYNFWWENDTQITCWVISITVYIHSVQTKKDSFSKVNVSDRTFLLPVSGAYLLYWLEDTTHHNTETWVADFS